MDVLDAIKSRKVQRNFAPQPVEPEKLRQIVSAGRHTMSARNKQPWQFIVIQNRTTLSELGALCATGKFVADAPSAIVILKDTTKLSNVYVPLNVKPVNTFNRKNKKNKNKRGKDKKRRHGGF